MGVFRTRGPQRLGNLDLHGGVDHMVFAADHMGDAEINVVDDRWQRVEIGAILADQHRVRLRGGVNMLRPPDQVMPFHPAAIQLEAPMGLAPLRFQACALFRR